MLYFGAKQRGGAKDQLNLTVDLLSRGVKNHSVCLPLTQIPETCQGRPFALHFVEVASEIYSLLLFIESSRLTTRKKGFRVKIPYLKYLWEAFDAARKVLEDRLEK